MTWIERGAAAFLVVALVARVCFANPATGSDLTSTLDRIFNRQELDATRFGPARWIDKGAAYTTVEPSPDFPPPSDEQNAPKDIVRYETATGARGFRFMLRSLSLRREQSRSSLKTTPGPRIASACSCGRRATGTDTTIRPHTNWPKGNRSGSRPCRLPDDPRGRV
jgi:hypothetical protein